MAKRSQLVGVLTFITILATSCAQIPVERSPASLPSSTDLSANSFQQRDLANEITQAAFAPKNSSAILLIVSSRNAKRLWQLFRALRTGQVLITSFDERLAKIARAQASGSPSSASKVPLLSSKFYQKLATTRELHLAVEEKLRAIFHDAAQSNADRMWIRDQIEIFGKEDAASAKAAGVIARYLADATDCNSTACRKSLSLDRIGFDPFDNYGAMKFSREHAAEIVQYAELKDSDFDAADGFSADRKPNSAVDDYNWRDRNWVKGNLQDGQFVFTYDDGPSREYTQPIKKLWAATAFPKPAYFRQVDHVMLYPDLVRDDFYGGYSVGVHSERHPDIGNLAKAQSAADLNKPNRIMFAEEIVQLNSDQFILWRDKTIDRETIGAIAKFTALVRTFEGFEKFKFHMYRLPYGSGMRTERVSQNFLKADVDHFYWAVDSLDWGDPNPESIKARVFEQMRLTKKGLILMHDVHPQTVTATQLILNELAKSNEFTVVGIKQMFKGATP